MSSIKILPKFNELKKDKGKIYTSRPVKRTGMQIIEAAQGQDAFTYSFSFEDNYNLNVSLLSYRDEIVFGKMNNPGKKSFDSSEYIVSGSTITLNTPLTVSTLITKYEIVITQVEERSQIQKKLIEVDVVLTYGTKQDVYDGLVDLADYVAANFVSEGWAEYVV